MDPMIDLPPASAPPASVVQSTRVLLLEDDLDHRHLFTRQLQKFTKPAHVIASADSLASAQALLLERADEVDVIVADLGLPDASGVQVIEGIVAVAPYKPIIVLSARLEQGVQAMRAGAQDYLVKGETDAAGLEQAIRHACTRQALANELRTTTRDAEQLVYSVSHDLRGPLSVASGFVSLLEKEPLPPEAEPLVAPIRRSLERLEAITEDLMAYARSVHGPLDLAVCDVAGLVRTVAHDQLIGPSVRVHDGMPILVADARLLRHLFENLLGNAHKYRHPDRELAIEVHARPHALGWQVDVDDNGIGIKPGSRERVFDMFVRAVDDASIEGTGIGLSICRRAVERHGGRIWAEDNPRGAGTRISFVLPGDLVATADDPTAAA